MSRVFLDSNVLLYAYGGPSPWRASCVEAVEQVADGLVEGHVSVEAMQEFLFHRLRRTDRGTATAESETLGDLLEVHPFDRDIWDAARHLVATTPIRGRDAVHAATALAQGFEEITTVDPAFEGVPGLTPITP